MFENLLAGLTLICFGLFFVSMGFIGARNAIEDIRYGDQGPGPYALLPFAAVGILVGVQIIYYTIKVFWL